jgi:hypothetical protein
MKTKTSQETKTTVELTGADLIRFLDLPDNAYDIRIYMKIPGGGDYSNMDLDVTNDTTPCFEVSYKTKEILPC